MALVSGSGSFLSSQPPPAMTPDALAAALASLEGSGSRTPTAMSLSRSSTPSQPMYYTTPSIPMKWRTGELQLDEDSMPLNLGVEKITDEEEQRWSTLGFRLPRRTVSSTHVQQRRGRDRSPRRFGIEVDWDCGICLEPASDPCVTRCGHLFCERDLTMWFRSKPADPRCPVCKTSCAPDRDVVPIFGRGAAPAAAAAAALLSAAPRRRRPFASRTPSMEAIPAGGTESDTTAEPPSLTASSVATPVPSGLATPGEPADDVLALLYPHAHPLVKHGLITHQLGRLLSLLGFVALMIFLLK